MHSSKINIQQIIIEEDKYSIPLFLCALNNKYLRSNNNNNKSKTKPYTSTKNGFNSLLQNI